MIHCAKCNYGWNPDSAKICVQCKSPLDPAPLPQRDALGDDLVHAESANRSAAAAEVPAPPASTPSAAQVTPPPPPSSQPFNNSAVNHPVAPEQAQGWKTVFAGSHPSPVVSEPSPAPAAVPPPVQVSAPHSVFPQGDSQAHTVAVDQARKIVGVLITYTWQQQGQLFPILEGRNLIGRDPAQCDIAIPQDGTLSAVNTFITYRRHFLIGDKISMSGTDVDGEPIETEFVPLRSHAQIRTGSTYWTFISLEPTQSSSTDAANGV